MDTIEMKIDFTQLTHDVMSTVVLSFVEDTKTLKIEDSHQNVLRSVDPVSTTKVYKTKVLKTYKKTTHLQLEPMATSRLTRAGRVATMPCILAANKIKVLIFRKICLFYGILGKASNFSTSASQHVRESQLNTCCTQR